MWTSYGRLYDGISTSVTMGFHMYIEWLPNHELSLWSTLSICSHSPNAPKCPRLRLPLAIHFLLQMSTQVNPAPRVEAPKSDSKVPLSFSSSMA